MSVTDNLGSLFGFKVHEDIGQAVVSEFKIKFPQEPSTYLSVAKAPVVYGTGASVT